MTGGCAPRLFQIFDTNIIPVFDPRNPLKFPGALLSAGLYGCNFKCVWFPSILRLISDLAAASQPCPPIIVRESVNRNYGKKHQCDEMVPASDEIKTVGGKLKTNVNHRMDRRYVKAQHFALTPLSY